MEEKESYSPEEIAIVWLVTNRFYGADTNLENIRKYEKIIPSNIRKKIDDLMNLPTSEKNFILEKIVREITV
jgi:hypothetical protein